MSLHSFELGDFRVNKDLEIKFFDKGMVDPYGPVIPRNQ